MNREEFHAYADKKIDEIYDRLDELEKKRDSATAAAKEKYSDQIEAAKKKRDELKADLQKLKGASGESWEELKLAFNESAESFKVHLSNIKARFNE
ncbi:MAG: hypothetical protein GC180_09640 [Bacteroidetes bacterium]|nr:hypothetical protein [Bacteroidota bacterium]